MSLDNLRNELAKIKAVLAAARAQNALLGLEIIATVKNVSISGLSSDEDACIQFEAYQAVRAAHSVEELAHAVARYPDGTNNLSRPLAMAFSASDRAAVSAECDDWISYGWQFEKVRESLVSAVKSEGVSAELAAHVLSAVLDSHEATGDVKALAAKARKAGFPTDERAIELLHSTRDGDRRLAAAIRDANNPSLRAALVGAIAQERNLSLASTLAGSLTEYPVELGEALRASQLGEAIVERLGNNCPPLRVPSLQSVRRALIDRERDPRPLRELRHIIEEFMHFGRFRHSDEIADLLQTVVAAYGALPWRPPRGPGAGLAVDAMTVKAVEQATSLSLVGPVWLEERDLPRWQYLRNIIPGHPLVIKHIELEQQLDKDRDRLAEERAALIESVAEYRGPSSREDEPMGSEQVALLVKHLPEVGFAAARRDRKRVSAFLRHAEEYSQRVRWTQDERGPKAARAAVMNEIAAVLPDDLPFDSEGVLGTYHPVDHRVAIFPWMIELWAQKNGWHADALKRVALLHETAHAALIVGRSAVGETWTRFDCASEGLHEALACIAAERASLDIDAEVYGLARMATELIFPDRALLALAEETPEFAIATARAGTLDTKAEENLRRLAQVLRAAGLSGYEAVVLDSIEGTDPLRRMMLLLAQLQFATFGPPVETKRALRLDLERTRRALRKSRLEPDAPLLAGGFAPAVPTRESFLMAIQTISDPNATESRKKKSSAR